MGGGREQVYKNYKLFFFFHSNLKVSLCKFWIHELSQILVIWIYQSKIWSVSEIKFAVNVISRWLLKGHQEYMTRESKMSLKLVQFSFDFSKCLHHLQSWFLQQTTLKLVNSKDMDSFESCNNKRKERNYPLCFAVF